MADRTVTVKSSGGDYTSLNAALSGESANLVTNTRNLTIECYSMSDTASAQVGTGYTTNATYRVNITVPTAERHVGVWNASKYNLSPTSGNGIYAFEDYVNIDGLQINISVGSANAAGISIALQNAANKINISNCIYKGPGGTVNNHSFIQISDADALVDIWNCMSYGLSTATSTDNSNIRSDAATTVNVYSCTLISGYKGLYRGAGTVTAKNVYCGNHGGGGDFNGTITKTTCASSDATGSTGLQNIAVNTTNFTNVTAGSENFHLPSGSALVNVGTDTSGDAAPLNFTNDIDGQTRTGTWDIGADEYVAAAAAGNPWNYYAQLQ